MVNQTKKLFILRGVPGSGKTTLAQSICNQVVSADDYFMVDGEYRFDTNKRRYSAHQYCESQCEKLMKQGGGIAVANTFTREREMKAYYTLAAEYGYQVFSIIVENRHEGVNVHNVPEEILAKMKNRFAIKL